MLFLIVVRMSEFRYMNVDCNGWVLYVESGCRCELTAVLVICVFVRVCRSVFWAWFVCVSTWWQVRDSHSFLEFLFLYSSVNVQCFSSPWLDTHSILVGYFESCFLKNRVLSNIHPHQIPREVKT
jgi:hypothetical protein